jgi:hypothetical protein
VENSASLREYAAALCAHWVTLLAGIGSIVFTVVTLIVPSWQAKYASVLLAVICALGASYKLWKVERNRYIETTKALAKPNLAPTIERCYESHSRKLLLDIDVVNRSTVSVTVKAVNLEIVLIDRIIPFSHRENATNSETQFYVEVLNENRRAMQSRSISDLLDEISEHPLERGTHKSGCLIFRFDELPPTDALKLRLTLTDAFGDKHITEEDVTTIKAVWADI